MSLQVIKRNINKLLILALAIVLLVTFVPGDVQAGQENLENSPITGIEGHEFEDTIYYVINNLVDPVPTWEALLADDTYGYTEKKYISLSQYYNEYTVSNQYKGTTTDGSGKTIHDYILRIDNARELLLFSSLTNPGTTVNTLSAATGGAQTSAEIMAHFLSKHYVLGNNIDWNDVPGEVFTPIGRGDTDALVERPFTGTFDGQGFEISNLVFAYDATTLSGSIYFGFFSYVGATGTVTRFGLYNPIINTYQRSGDMRVAGICGKNAGTIEYVYVTGINPLGYTVNGPVGVAGLVYENCEGATFKNAYYTGSVISADSICNIARVYPVYYTNKSVNVEQLYYNRDKFQPTNNLPAIVTAKGYARDTTANTYTALQAAYQAAYGTTIAVNTMTAYVYGTTLIPTDILANLCALLNVTAEDIYSAPRLRELIDAMDRTTLPVSSYTSFREAFNEFAPATNISIADINAYINGTKTIPSVGGVRDKFCAFLGLQDTDLDEPDVVANAIKRMGFDIASYVNFRAAFNAALPATSVSQGVFDAYILGALDIPADIQAKLCSYFNTTWSGLDTYEERHAAIINAGTGYWPKYSGFLLKLNAAGPKTNYSEANLEQFLCGTVTVKTGNPDSVDDFLGQICRALDVGYGDIVQNRNLSEPGEVRPMRDDELLWRQWGLTDPTWRRNDYRAVNSLHTAEQLPLTTYPKLQGFSGDVNPATNLPISTIGTTWGNSTTAPLILLTPADVIYFAKFLSAGQNYRTGTSDLQSSILNRVFFIGACIDMSSVAPDAYRLTTGDYTPGNFSQGFTGTLYGSPKDTGTSEAYWLGHDDCDICQTQTITDEVYSSGTTPIAKTPNHCIINLSLQNELYTNVHVLSDYNAGYTPANQYTLGFLPLMSGGTVENINFIGGLVSPASYNANANLIDTQYYVGGVVGMRTSGTIRNVHSSAHVIIPDGDGRPFYAGGITGYGPVQYCSFNGVVSGGIHPYVAARAPNSNRLLTTISDGRYVYATGGIAGMTSGSLLSNCNNFGRVEAAGFYNVPEGTEFAEFGVLAGGIAGICESRYSNVGVRVVNNYGDIYALPMDMQAGIPREAPDGSSVLSLSPIVGGLVGGGTQLSMTNSTNAASVAPGNAFVNYGKINVYQATGTLRIGGAMGSPVSSGYSYADRVVNFGDITISDSTGNLFAAGILTNSRPDSDGGSNMYLCINFGNITATDNNNFDQVVVGGMITTRTAVTQMDTQNYGSITIDNANADCTLTRVHGLVATLLNAATNGAQRSAHNYGNISVTTAQNSGKISVSGISDGRVENDYGAFNAGNITVNATAANSSAAIYVGGIKGYSDSNPTLNNVMNTGDITVTASTSDMIYVGGVAARMDNTSFRALNTGSVTLHNGDTSGSAADTVYVGGVYGYGSGSEGYDLVNNGTVTVTTAALKANVAGIYGWKANGATHNCLNYGNVTLHSTTAGAPTAYVSGVMNNLYTTAATGVFLNTGLVNHGTITETHATATANAGKIYAAGISAYYHNANASGSLQGLVNYGTILNGDGSHKAAILIRSANWTTANIAASPTTGVRFTHMLNTDPNTDMFYEVPTTTGTNSEPNAINNYYMNNLLTTNANDSMLSGTITRYALFNGRIAYIAPEEVYAEESPLRNAAFSDAVSATGRENLSLVYVPYEYLAEHLRDGFPNGMYAVTVRDASYTAYFNTTAFSVDVESHIYLPDSMAFTGAASIAPRQYFTAGYVDYLNADDMSRWNWVNEWFTQNRVQNGAEIPGSSAQQQVINSKQVDMTLNIIKMSLQADADPRWGSNYTLARPILAEIYTRDENGINFFYTEDALGKTFRIRTYQLTDQTAILSGDEENTVAWGDVVFELPDEYISGTTDLEDMTVSVVVYAIQNDGTATPFTLNMILVPDPKIELRTIDQSLAGLYALPTASALSGSFANHNRVTYSVYNTTYDATELELLDDGTYVLKKPVYWFANGYSGGLIQLTLYSYNLGEVFYPEAYASVIRMHDNADVTSSFRFTSNGGGGSIAYTASWVSSYRTALGKFLSGSDKTSANPSLVSNLRLYKMSSDFVEEGWYTLYLTVNNKDLIQIRFYYVNSEYGRFYNSVGGGYAENTVWENEGIITDFSYVRQSKTLYGRSLYNFMWYVYGGSGDSKYGYDPPYMDLVDGTTLLGKYLISAELNPDGSHSYHSKVALAPNYASGDGVITWWDLYAEEAAPDTASSTVSKVMVGDNHYSDPTATTIVVPADNRLQTVKLTNTFANVDLQYSASPLEFEVVYEGEPLKLINVVDKRRFAFSLDGVEVLRVTWTAQSIVSTIGGGEYDYVIEVLPAAPMGEYKISTVYNKTFAVTQYALPEGQEWPVGNTVGVNGLPLSITLDANGVPVVPGKDYNVTWNAVIGETITVIKPESNDSYLTGMYFPGMIKGELAAVPAITPNPISLAANGAINYTSVVNRTGDDRVKEFVYELYIGRVADENYRPQFTLPKGATLYIWDESINGWAATTGTHTADYTPDPDISVIRTIRYKVVAADGSTSTLYTVNINGLPRNKGFHILTRGGSNPNNASGEYDLTGVKLQQYLQTNKEDIFVNLMLWDGENSSNVHGAAYINNNMYDGYKLPYSFPMQTEGAYKIEIILPEGLDFYLDISQETENAGLGYPRKVGNAIYVDLPGSASVVHYTYNIVVFIKEDTTQTTRLGVHKAWDVAKNGGVMPTASETVYLTGTVTFLPVTDYDNKRYVTETTEQETGLFNAYFNDVVVVEAGAVVKGSIYSTKAVEIYGTVEGDVFSEGSITVSGAGTVGGTINAYTLG